MNKYVADTMAIVLFLENRRLPAKISEIFNGTVQGDLIIYVSTVSLMEIGYLSEKKRIDISIPSLLTFVHDNTNFVINDLNSKTVLEAFKIKTIPELHDRLITATASILSANLITNDPIIIRSQYVKTIW